MADQALYKELAKYYDLIYSFKDYKKESEILVKLIRKYKQSDDKSLLDVGCGTNNQVRSSPVMSLARSARSLWKSRSEGIPTR